MTIKPMLTNMDRLLLWESISKLPDYIDQINPDERIALWHMLYDKMEKLDEAIKRDKEAAESWGWFKEINSVTFEDRMRAMRIHAGRSSGDQYDLTRAFRDVNIEIEIDERCQKGMTKKAAYQEVAKAANLSPSRVKQLYLDRQKYYKSL